MLQSRMSGVLEGMREILGDQSEYRIARVPGGAERAVARSAVKSILAKRPKAKRVLIAASSDDGGMGALEAIDEFGIAGSCAIVGMEGSKDAIRQIAKERSPYVGTVAYHPENYGPALVDLVFRLMNGEQVPPFWYVDHEFIDISKARKLNLNVAVS